jgi:photosystem II stability/assembly factor-like uncharacterized protein
VITTIDGGEHWNVMTVPGAEKLDFRDIEAFDANTAYILSIGNGESSRIYKTTDGGTNWKLQFKNTNEKAFFDAIACFSRQTCFIVSDPVDNLFILLETQDGGVTWRPMYSAGPMPKAEAGEAAFAASGSCLVIGGPLYRYLVTGGSNARVFRAFRTPDSGWLWDVFKTPITKGFAQSGIFSAALFDLSTGVIVGGNYEKPNEAKDNLAFTTDGGGTWTLGSGLTGYRSGVTYVNKKTIVAVGTNGSDISRDGGKTWNKLGNENLNAVHAKGKRAVWAVGPSGLVVKMK